MRTPKPVLEAFYPPTSRVGAHVLQPLNMAHFLLLEMIDSPFTRSRDEAEENPTPPDSLDLARALYVTTRTDDELCALAKGYDAAKFEDDVWAFSLTVPVGEMAQLMPKMVALFTRATSTLIGGGDDDPPEEEDAKKKASKTSTAKVSRTATGGR